MNFDLENPYIEYDSDDIPYSLYEIHGVNKIRELSRQLRTFLNYKTAMIQYRFRPKTATYPDRVEEKYKETERSLKQLALKFIKLLANIRGNSFSYEIELERLVFNLAYDKIRKSLLTELKDVTQKLFTTIHALSEQEIHLHPKFLKFIANLTQEACIVFKILNNWASGFYEELRVNYVQLHDELTLLIPEEYAEKSTVRKHKSLEEGLREW
ncbi:MAG: hypothetical protein E3J90_12595 [Promethearchaeota archaeon]|nr:MAG: hypothetical protein E3J90_12595 [Candidatus Lokiarchaeota archaeon]